MSTKPEFDLSRIRSIRGASITEFRMYSPKVARVIATFVGEQTPEEATDRLTACLNGLASPIRSSFRWLEKNRSAIGFVSQVTPVRMYDEKTVTAKYQRINANLFMDPSDKSIWETKSGSGGQYLARKGEDNLAELIEAARSSPRGSVPRMMSVMAAAARPQQFVAFVDKDGSAVDYGFCLAPTDDGYNVLSYTTKQTASIERDGVIGVYSLDVPENIKSKVTASAGYQKDASTDYYKRLYSYAPEYLEQVIRQVEQQAVL